VQHLPAKSRWAFLLVTVLSVVFIAAGQNLPPLLLTASVEPAVPSSGEAVTLQFTIANAGDQSLEEVEVTVPVPSGTGFERAAADNQQWDIDLLPGVVRYRATGPLPAAESAELVLVVIVQEEPGQSIVLDGYEASAKGFEEAIVGAPLTIPVGMTASPTATLSTTQTPTGTMTVAPLTGTATQTPTPEPSPSATATPPATRTPEPTPTPTITVVVAELPPTPTPNLSTEQEVVGTITVLIFVGLVVVVIVFVVTWMVRSGKSA
jgi:uncharacterized repeat protein (TIGR01451 family)